VRGPSALQRIAKLLGAHEKAARRKTPVTAVKILKQNKRSRCPHRVAIGGLQNSRSTSNRSAVSNDGIHNFCGPKAVGVRRSIGSFSLYGRLIACVFHLEVPRGGGKNSDNCVVVVVKGAPRTAHKTPQGILAPKPIGSDRRKKDTGGILTAGEVGGCCAAPRARNPFLSAGSFYFLFF